MPRPAAAGPLRYPAFFQRWISWTPYLLSVLRIVTAFLFMQYGSTKLYGLPAEIMPGGGTASPLSLAGIAAILELFGESTEEMELLLASRDLDLVAERRFMLLAEDQGPHPAPQP